MKLNPGDLIAVKGYSGNHLCYGVFLYAYRVSGIDYVCYRKGHTRASVDASRVEKKR